VPEGVRLVVPEGVMSTSETIVVAWLLLSLIVLLVWARVGYARSGS
jgi:hypothetical protein